MRKKLFNISILFFCYALLYLPMINIIVYSFNASKITSVWQGFSFKWYKAVLNNPNIISGLFTSLKLATISATVATIIGTLAAFALVRHKRFKGRNIFESMVHMPLVMPEVITGLSLMLFLFWLRDFFYLPAFSGITPIAIAHITLGVAYVTVIVRARLSDYDMAVEEAAMDLGAHPSKVFFRITIPIIAPSCVAGWFLAFALSLDDVVLASFLSSPESTTLPMVIFSSLKMGATPQINALATIMIGVVLTGVLLAGLYMYGKQRKAMAKEAVL